MEGFMENVWLPESWGIYKCQPGGEWNSSRKGVEIRNNAVCVFLRAVLSCWSKVRRNVKRWSWRMWATEHAGKIKKMFPWGLWELAFSAAYLTELQRKHTALQKVEGRGASFWDGCANPRSWETATVWWVIASPVQEVLQRLTGLPGWTPTLC